MKIELWSLDQLVREAGTNDAHAKHTDTIAQRGGGGGGSHTDQLTSHFADPARTCACESGKRDTKHRYRLESCPICYKPSRPGSRTHTHTRAERPTTRGWRPFLP